MTRRLLSTLLIAGLALALTGCASGVKPGGSGGSTTPTATAEVSPFAAIPTDGVHEKAALAAIPDALTFVEKTTREQGREVVDVSAGKPTLVSYVLFARAGQRVALFEVRGDGKAYELYRYPAAPDPANLFWQDAANSTGTRLVEPLGTGETAAASAVRKVVESAAPGEDVTVSIQGYTFVWLTKDGEPVSAENGGAFTIMIDPEGAAGSWTS